MIIATVSHGRREEDARRLAAHLAKTHGQTTTIARSSGLTPGLSIAGALSDLRRMTALSPRAKVGFHHLSINPASEWTSAQRDEAISRVLKELGASENAWLLVEHAEKARAAPGGANRHFHFVLAHVGPHGRALDMQHSYIRLEAVARTCEHDFREPITPSRHPKAVASILAAMGREDVARTMRAAQPASAPRSAMSRAGRQRGARLGFDLPKIRAAVRAAWAAPDFASTFASEGLRLAPGRRPGVIVVKTKEGVVAGALDRLAGVTREEARRRVEAEMARQRRKQEIDNDGLQQQRRTRARVAREGAEEARTGNTGRRGHITGAAATGGGIVGPRLLGADRGEIGPADVDPAAARRRRVRALIELRQAEAVAKRRRRRGRTPEGDAQTAKAALATKLFGKPLSMETIAALHFLDLTERLASLRSGGWVRDAGDKLYASGADPAVVSLMVEAAKAKGWSSVILFGEPAFIAEATRQFEAAGIAVDAENAPPAAAVMDAPAGADEIFRRRLAEADASLERLRAPLPPTRYLERAERAEAEADAAWRALLSPRDEARKRRDEAESALEKAGFLSRPRAKAAFDEAVAEHEKAREIFEEACEAHQKAKQRAAAERRRQKDREERHRAEVFDAEKRFQSARAFALACLASLEADRKLASASVEAIEEATRLRLAAEKAPMEANDAEVSSGAEMALRPF